jgi:hypothetical protein
LLLLRFILLCVDDIIGVGTGALTTEVQALVDYYASRGYYRHIYQVHLLACADVAGCDVEMLTVSPSTIDMFSSHLSK